jgi:hypothetical protein
MLTPVHDGAQSMNPPWRTFIPDTLFLDKMGSSLENLDAVLGGDLH